MNRQLMWISAVLAAGAVVVPAARAAVARPEPSWTVVYLMDPRYPPTAPATRSRSASAPGPTGAPRAYRASGVTDPVRRPASGRTASPTGAVVPVRAVGSTQIVPVTATVAPTVAPAVTPTVVTRTSSSNGPIPRGTAWGVYETPWVTSLPPLSTSASATR